MTDYGYHASHEQFSPDALGGLLRRAEERGFEGILASDQIHPWRERQGNAGHVWSWLGAAMEVTSLSFGTVTAPGYRYHPTVVARQWRRSTDCLRGASGSRSAAASS